jgi:hypothetical protein
VIAAVPAQHVAVPACRSEITRVRLGRSEGAAGTIDVPIIFTNTGSVRCTLRGFPGVSSFGAPGDRQIGAPARRLPVVVRTVVLAPHASASAIYGQAQALNYPKTRCHPRAASGLRVYPPNQTHARLLRSKHLACSSTGVGDSSIGTVVPGTTGQVR